MKACSLYLVQWDTQDEVEEHFRSERFRRLLPYIEMSVEPPEVEVSAIDRVGGIEFLVARLARRTVEFGSFNRNANGVRGGSHKRVLFPFALTRRRNA